jgi:uncharacterized protein (TIGR03032 family)
MRLDTEFIRLPLRFDPGRLAAEVAEVAEAAWRPHPQGYPGNSALPLIAAGGDPGDDATKGPMRPTPHLARLPYLRQVLAAFGTVLGRTRLMRLDGNAEATAHADTNYYWMERARIHVPVVTTPGVRFLCGDRAVHMEAGEAWVFDTWQRHNVLNPEPTRRIHLVADTVGSAFFWDLVERGEGEPRFVPFRPDEEPELVMESVNQPVVQSPWEQEVFFRMLLDELAAADVPLLPLIAELRRELDAFRHDWRALWARCGDAPEGWPAYRELLGRLTERTARFEHRLLLPNRIDAIEMVRQMVIRPALNPELADPHPRPLSRAAPMPPPRTGEGRQEEQEKQQEETPRRASAVLPSPGDRVGGAGRGAGGEGPAPPAASPPDAFRSVFTAGLPQILEQLGVSLLVSTYQSGRIVAVRSDGGQVNTHFRAFPSPMGMAAGPRYLALGTQRHVWEYRNQPEVGRRLDPPGKHDACFLPRASHVTGDIRIHEMAFAGDDLWLVNTRFSCLSRLDAEHSFVPVWRPPFVSRLAPEDRCHLNGLAVDGRRIAYVTALGATDTPQGWREGKAAGGVLLDAATGAPVARGLSMPHSPRLYAGKLWVLESGKGTVAVVDPADGRVETVAELPGFTRGLAFAGPFAFVGLSQVRESNIFGGIPLTERLRERVCGVWVLDVRTGRVAGFLRFEGIVQEVFDVQVLHGIRYPEIVEPDADLTATSFVVPAEALAEVAPAGV